MAPRGEYPYQDRTIDVGRRVEDLMARIDLRDKVGLMFHTMAPVGDLEAADPAFGLPSLASMVTKRRMTHFNLLGSAPSGREFAAWHNAAQELAARAPLGIPITFSTDPRHAFVSNPGTAMVAGPFSQWPEPLGLAATRSERLVEEFADVARREYLAVGIRVALHPQVDLVTEPRWSRASGTFGEDADLAARLVRAYVRGFHGGEFGARSVSTMTKHFPGGGPQRDGEDPHFAYGREQVYPGGMFEYHLIPFEAAIEAGTRQIMPYYGMPVGTEHEEVGFAFSRSVITGLLRERLGFRGIVCTDWGLLSDAEVLGQPMPARAWGVEHLSRPERMLRALDAGVDQFGGELCTEVLLALVAEGAVSESRLDESVRRLLTEKFLLGLFDDPVIDVEAAQVVGCAEFRAAGLEAQRASVTVLADSAAVDGHATLPLTEGVRLYVDGVDPTTAAGYGTVVSDPIQADVAVLRLQAPFETRGGGFESFFHAGSLDFPDDELDRVRALCALVPTVVDVYLDRPAVLTAIDAVAAALVADFGCSDSALLDVLFGRSTPRGSLPFDLPRSMAAVEASREDVPFDTVDPLYRFGHGLRYGD